MKRVTLILVVLLTATCPLGAGEWRIGGHIGTGFSGGHHRGGTSIGFSNFGLGHHRVAYPGGGFVLHIGGDDFSFTWTGGGLRSRYHRYPRYRRYRRYRRYYRTPYYVLGPWCWYGGYGGAVVTGTWGGRSVFEDPPVVRGGGDVFLVPVSGTPAADAGELEGIDAPIPQPAPTCAG